MFFDGRAFAESRRKDLLKERRAFSSISLGVVMSADDPVTSSFVRIKEKNAAILNVDLKRYTISHNADTQETHALLEKAAHENDGIIVQLPLPERVDTNEIIKHIPANKDVDALSPALTEALKKGEASVMPPVAKAIKEIILSENIEVKGKDVVVIGKGKLVGAPVAQLLKQLGGNVTVLGAGDTLSEKTRNADIIVLGAGNPGLLKEDMVKDGVVVFDAGTSESGGVVVGDADPQVAEKASFFTPVPGGIGPVAVVEIFSNLFLLKKNAGK